MSNTTHRLPTHIVEAVTAAPDDDGPRLAAAEWLTARGDPWGELIGVQCAIAATQATDGELLERERAWLDAHRDERSLDIGQVRAIVASSRDDLRVLDLSAYCVDSLHDTSGVPASLFDASRLRLERLCLGLGSEIDVAAWAASPVIASLAELHLHVSSADPTRVASLLRSPSLAHLRRITVFSWDEGWERFVGDLGRSGLHFEEPRSDWDWVAS